MFRRVVTSLARSTDLTGILVVGGLLTLSTWIALPIWAAATLAAPPVAVVGPLVLTPAFIVRGYFVRVLADGIEAGNEEGAASFVAWHELYRDGVRSAALSAVLLAPLSLLLAAATLAGVALRSETVDPEPIAAGIEGALGPSGTTAVAAAAIGLLTAITAAYLLAFAYVKPAALAAFAASGRLRDGLRPSRIVRVAGSGEYAAAWVVAAAALAAGYALAGPLVPLLVGGVVVFAVRAVAHGVYGRGARAALSGTASADGDAATVAGGTDASEIVPPSGAPPASPASRAATAAGPRARPARSRGDGGSRPPRAEAPPAVQSGRAVPIDREQPFEAAGGTRGASAADGNRDVSAADGNRGNPGVATGRDAAADTTDPSGFEWVSADETDGGKDKS